MVKTPTIKKLAYYAVRIGRKTGIYDNWPEAQAQIIGFPKPDYKKFELFAEAQNFLHSTDVLYERSASNLWTPNSFPLSYFRSPQTLWVFTDGSSLGNRNVVNAESPSGWGFAVIKCYDLDELGEASSLIAEKYGKVCTDSTNNDFLGAEYGSNNTGELSAVGQALLWLKRLYSNQITDISPDIVKSILNLPVMMLCDSVYAANSVLGLYNGSKNKALIEHTRGLLKSVRELQNARKESLDNEPRLIFSHVKGHSSHKWNDLADELANKGAGI